MKVKTNTCVDNDDCVGDDIDEESKQNNNQEADYCNKVWQNKSILK